MITLNLPYPPSVNSIWRRVGNKTLLSAKGRIYRENVAGICLVNRVSGMAISNRISVLIEVNPPDKRKRDLDNVPKAVFDALTHAGVWVDDSQIDEMTVKRLAVVKNGNLKITINEAMQA